MQALFSYLFSIPKNPGGRKCRSAGSRPIRPGFSICPVIPVRASRTVRTSRTTAWAPTAASFPSVADHGKDSRAKRGSYHD